MSKETSLDVAAIAGRTVQVSPADLMNLDEAAATKWADEIAAVSASALSQREPETTALFKEGRFLSISLALQDVSAERARQINDECWSHKHDDAHASGELALAAACYAGDRRKFNTAAPRAWPWAQEWWKPGTDRRRQLVKAGALIVAEIERLDRAAAKAASEQ